MSDQIDVHLDALGESQCRLNSNCLKKLREKGTIQLPQVSISAPSASLEYFTGE